MEPKPAPTTTCATLWYPHTTLRIATVDADPNSSNDTQSSPSRPLQAAAVIHAAAAKKVTNECDEGIPGSAMGAPEGRLWLITCLIASVKYTAPIDPTTM
mmetsp:Transcript_10854/g.12397  ORF Transcript_10854/g.12397 Transcript_10854/m.12397 type:complete len:100 (+) Transcript_10854:832-1131(+)